MKLTPITGHAVAIWDLYWNKGEPMSYAGGILADWLDENPRDFGDGDHEDERAALCLFLRCRMLGEHLR